MAWRGCCEQVSHVLDAAVLSRVGKKILARRERRGAPKSTVPHTREVLPPNLSPPMVPHQTRPRNEARRKLMCGLRSVTVLDHKVIPVRDGTVALVRIPAKAFHICGQL
jgi:hypothetical protein